VAELPRRLSPGCWHLWNQTTGHFWTPSLQAARTFCKVQICNVTITVFNRLTARHPRRIFTCQNASMQSVSNKHNMYTGNFSEGPKPIQVDQWPPIAVHNMVMFYHCFHPSAAMNLHILFVHAGMTGRYHNEPLDSLITILSQCSFLKSYMY